MSEATFKKLLPISIALLAIFLTNVTAKITLGARQATPISARVR